MIRADVAIDSPQVRHEFEVIRADMAIDSPEVRHGQPDAPGRSGRGRRGRRPPPPPRAGGPPPRTDRAARSLPRCGGGRRGGESGVRGEGLEETARGWSGQARSSL